MSGFIKRAVAWGVAVIVTAGLAVIFQTQNVIARLGGIGAEIGLSERLSMTLFDLRYLGTLYILFIGVALLVAYSVGGLLFRFVKFGRPIIYIVAGAVAMIIMLFGMKAAFFDVHLIAGARSGAGLALQMLAGAMGGFVFAKMSAPKPAS